MTKLKVEKLESNPWKLESWFKEMDLSWRRSDGVEEGGLEGCGGLP